MNEFRRRQIRNQIDHYRRRQQERFARQESQCVGICRRIRGVGIADTGFDMVLTRAYARWENAGPDDSRRRRGRGF